MGMVTRLIIDISVTWCEYVSVRALKGKTAETTDLTLVSCVTETLQWMSGPAKFTSV